MWFQCSKEKQLVDGDRSTIYYQLKVVQCIRRNNIVMIKNVDGDWVEDENQVCHLFINHYREIFSLN